MRHFGVVPAVVATLAAAAPAQAQTVSISAGETITLEFRDGKAAVIDRRPAPPISAYEMLALGRMQVQDIPKGATTVPPVLMSRNDVPVEPPRILPNKVQLTFRQVPALQAGESNQTLLTLSNGYDRSFHYHAVMNANGRSARTDVCELRPNWTGNEHWPYVIARLDLSDLRLDSFDEGNVRCE